MADAKAPAAEKEVPAGPKLIMGLPLPIFLFAAINTIVTVGSLGFIVQAALLYKKPAITEEQVTAEITKVEKKKVEETETEVLTVSYPEMTITLKGEQGGKTHFATVEASLVCGSDTCKSEVDENRAKIEDVIQTVMSAHSYTELTSLETKFRVKNQILNQVNSFLKSSSAVDFLFTNFLIQ
jgi:flagellar basal body-associated protein FliL